MSSLLAICTEEVLAQKDLDNNFDKDDGVIKKRKGKCWDIWCDYMKALSDGKEMYQETESEEHTSEVSEAEEKNGNYNSEEDSTESSTESSTDESGEEDADENVEEDADENVEEDADENVEEDASTDTVDTDTDLDSEFNRSQYRLDYLNDILARSEKYKKEHSQDTLFIQPFVVSIIEKNTTKASDYIDIPDFRDVIRDQLF